MSEIRFMEEAVRLSRENIRDGRGGPFGAVVVRGGAIVARGTNRVTAGNDPTAHAEIVAIREACRSLRSFHLADCDLYSSCEPCPMCLGAIYWAHIRRVFFANTRKDAAAIGFDDEFLYTEIGVGLTERKIPIVQLGGTDALQVFREWERLENKTPY